MADEQRKTLTLKEYNQEYEKALAKFNTKDGKISRIVEDNQKKIDNLRAKREDLRDGVKKAEADLSIASRNNDEAGKQAAEATKKDLEKQIAELNEKMSDLKEYMEFQKGKLAKEKAKIDAYVDQVREKPEMKKHMDEALAKRYGRKVKRYVDARNEVMSKRNGIESLKTYPDTGKHALELIEAANKARQPIRDYREIAKTKAEKEARHEDVSSENAKLAELEPKLKAAGKAGEQFMKELGSYQGLNLTVDDIDNLGSFVMHNKNNGQVNTLGSIQAMSAKLNRQIKGYNKSIGTNQIAMENHGYVLTTDGQIMSRDELERSQENAENPEQANQENNDEKKPNVFKRMWAGLKHFFGKFGHKNDEKTLPEGQDQNEDARRARTEEAGQAQEDRAVEQSKGRYANSFKYKIAQDAVKSQEEIDFRQAQEQMRRAKSVEEHDKDERNDNEEER